MAWARWSQVAPTGAPAKNSMSSSKATMLKWSPPLSSVMAVMAASRAATILSPDMEPDRSST